MNCPNCSTKMSVEHTKEVTFSPGYKREPQVAENWAKGKSVPAAIYRCDECDSEWIWVRGVRGMRLVDGGFSKRDVPGMRIEDVTCGQDEPCS